jgi:hypothetical protein
LAKASCEVAKEIEGGWGVMYQIFQECSTGDIVPLDIQYKSLSDAINCVNNPDMAGISWAAYDKSNGECVYARFL